MTCKHAFETSEICASVRFSTFFGVENVPQIRYLSSALDGKSFYTAASLNQLEASNSQVNYLIISCL
jgi:hypothetical protein